MDYSNSSYICSISPCKIQNYISSNKKREKYIYTPPPKSYIYIPPPTIFTKSSDLLLWLTVVKKVVWAYWPKNIEISPGQIYKFDLPRQKFSNLTSRDRNFQISSPAPQQFSNLTWPNLPNFISRANFFQISPSKFFKAHPAANIFKCHLSPNFAKFYLPR